MPPTPPPPLCPSYHLHSPHHLHSLNPRPLPHLRRLYLRHPSPYLPTQSALSALCSPLAFPLPSPVSPLPLFIRVIRDSDELPTPSAFFSPFLHSLCPLPHSRFPLPSPVSPLPLFIDSDTLPARFTPPAFPRAGPNASGLVPVQKDKSPSSLRTRAFCIKCRCAIGHDPIASKPSANPFHPLQSAAGVFSSIRVAPKPSANPFPPPASSP